MIIVGRITKDAVVNQLKDERRVVNFTVALNDFYKPKGSEKGVQVTTYVNCSYWISTTVAERLTKGSLVEIAGRIYVNAYKAMDGEARASINCHVSSIKVHQSQKSTADEVAAKKEKEEKADLPF